MADELASLEEELTKNGRGPGFILGLLFGTIGGAVIAMLFAPTSGEELAAKLDEAGISPELGEPGDDRVRSVLAQVRSRVQQASREAQQARAETEQELQERYQRLVSNE